MRFKKESEASTFVGLGSMTIPLLIVGSTDRSLVDVDVKINALKENQKQLLDFVLYKNHRITNRHRL